MVALGTVMINVSLLHRKTKMTIQEIKSNYHNVDWLKSNYQKIHYFGLGFIQLKLTPNYRLHFYTKQLPPIVGDEDIHDHRYSFLSHILRGRFEQYLFKMIDGTDYNLEYESCAENAKSEFIKQCSFELISSSVYTAGSSYFIHGNTFHRVKAEEAITLLFRPTDYAKEKARVATLVGQKKVCPFSKRIPEKELWEIIAGKLGYLTEEDFEIKQIDNKKALSYMKKMHEYYTERYK